MGYDRFIGKYDQFILILGDKQLIHLRQRTVFLQTLPWEKYHEKKGKSTLYQPLCSDACRLCIPLRGERIYKDVDTAKRQDDT